jgi:phage baseplate assembly protein W
MPNPKYGITFPFGDSEEGLFLGMNELADAEVRSNLVHLILTIKGSRYFLPDFGTNLMRLIFEPLDSSTKASIDREIRDAVGEFIPKLKIDGVEVKTVEDLKAEEGDMELDPKMDDNTFSFAGDSEREYTVRVRIDYSIGSGVFESRDFVIINL